MNILDDTRDLSAFSLHSSGSAAGAGPAKPLDAGLAQCAPAGNVALLSTLPDLARDLGPRERETAQRGLVVPAVTVRAGQCSLETCADAVATVGPVLALLVTDGLLIGELRIGRNTSAQIYGPGDVLDGQPAVEDGSLPVTRLVTVPKSATLAILDDRALVAMRRWPRLMSGLLAQGFAHAARADARLAISQLSRVEDRLLALFWHLADRWGRRRGDGILIDVALTHETIGRLVGARRPTVSLALRALKEQGLLTRRTDGSWMLAPESLDRFQPDSPPWPASAGEVA